MVVSVKISDDSIGDMVIGMFDRVGMVDYAQSCMIVKQDVGGTEVT